MARTLDVLAHLLARYPNEYDLSNARVTKMVYLSDWRHCLQERRQITDIQWFYDNYGPFVWDVKNTAEQHPDLFSVEERTNMYGTRKTCILPTGAEYEPQLLPSEREAIDHVISVTKDLPWGEFMKLVYSTYPILTSEQYSLLDLPRLAEEYQNSELYRQASGA